MSDMTKKPRGRNALAGLLSPQNALAGGMLSSQTLGYQMRQPYESEQKYFYANPHVGGMAAEDGKIVMNPFSSLSPQERAAVAQNEAYRLYMRESGYQPNSAIAPDQVGQFGDTAYARDPNAMRQTLLARTLTGDPSARPTAEQKAEAERVRRGALQNMAGRLLRR